MKIHKEDIKNMLGIENDLKAFSELEENGLAFRKLEWIEYEIEILRALQRIEKDTQIVGTPERTTVWENGWKENLEELKKNRDTISLFPKYFHSEFPIRYQGGFIKSDIPDFQVRLDLFIKKCLFEQYAEKPINIYEFGCGTGYNLVMSADTYPDKQFYGMDFTKSAVDIMQILREEMEYPIFGRQFDFTCPDETLQIEESNVVFTFAALEQIGDRYQPFIDYLLKSGAERIVHLEPIVELYDDNVLLDYLAKQFHTKRHYLNGLYPYLRELENKGRITIEKVQRLHLGNHNHEAYTLIVWHPKEK